MHIQWETIGVQALSFYYRNTNTKYCTESVAKEEAVQTTKIFEAEERRKGIHKNTKMMMKEQASNIILWYVLHYLFLVVLLLITPFSH